MPLVPPDCHHPAVIPDWLRCCSANGGEIVEFCRARGDLLGHLKTALDLVKETFPSAGNLEVRLEDDPEIEGQSLVVEVRVADLVDRVLDAYDRCLAAWVRALPPGALSVLCLSYRIL